MAIRTHSFDGIPPAPREDEFITTIYKRFGEGTSVGFLLSTVNFVPLNCKHLWYFFYKHDLPTLHVFFSCIGIHLSRSHSFSLPHGPISRSIQIVWGFGKSQEQEQQVQDLKKQINLSKSLIPESPMTRGLNTCSWAYRTFLDQQKLRGTGGL